MIHVQKRKGVETKVTHSILKDGRESENELVRGTRRRSKNEPIYHCDKKVSTTPANGKKKDKLTPCDNTILNMKTTSNPAVLSHLLRTCGVHLSRVC